MEIKSNSKIKNNNLSQDSKTNKKIIVVAVFILIVSVMFSTMFSGCLSKLPIKLNENKQETEIETAGEDTSGDLNDGLEDSNSQESQENAGSATTESSLEGKKYANDFTLLDMEGNEVSLHDYQGKIVVLNFWATWCPPCRAEIPDFVEVYNSYKGKSVQFFGVSDDDPKSLNDFIKEYNINYPTLLDGTKDRIMGKWGIDAIPHTFILNGNGEVFYDQLGLMTKDQLIKAIEAALQAEKE